MNKINWLSILQGWSMLLVVVGHVTLTGVFENPQTPVSAEIERIVYSFHMPLFMFVSGFLFYLTKLGKRKSYGRTVKDKAKRLLIPYAAFTLATFVLKYAFAPLMKRPVGFTWWELFDVLTFTSNPLGEMWFISTLFILFLFYPVYRWSLQNKARSGFLLAAALLACWFFPKGIRLFCLSNVFYFLVFFYSGILFSRYRLYDCLRGRKVLSGAIAGMVLCALFPCFPVLAVFAGIFFSLSLCLVLSGHVPRLFGSFRDYTFQIFLMGIFFQMAVRYVYAWIGMESLYWPLYLVSILLGVYVPVLISRMLLRIGNKNLNRCFGL